MKKGIMKLAVSTFVLAILFSTSMMAQRGQGKAQKVNGEKPTAEERANRMTEKMTKKLELNDYQSDQISALNLNLAQELISVKESDLAREEKKEAAKNLKDTYTIQVSALLDAEQNEKFLKFQEKGKGKRGGKKGGKGNRGDRGQGGELEID